MTGAHDTIKEIGALTGRVLLFGGAYSNLQAMLAVRAEAERRGIPPVNIICTGDTVGYCADPRDCIELQRRWGIHAIAGNVESNLVAGKDDCGCGFGDGSRCDLFAKLWYAYAAGNVTEANLNYMAKLPDVLRFTYAGKRVGVYHGSPRHQSEFVWASTDEATKAAMLQEADVDVLIGGHCGLPFGQRIGGYDNWWINPGVIGMPANDGTPRTWFAILDDANGLSLTYHALNYDYAAAKSSMLDDRRLPLSYAATLTTGIWDNTEIMPAAEEAQEGSALVASQLSGLTKPEDGKPSPLSKNKAPRQSTGPAEGQPAASQRKNSNMATYSDPKDLRTFGKIAEWQPEMGKKFFDWYGGVTEGDTALTEREKALIALAVSHAIQCSYCIDAYTTNSLQAGADEEQMMEAVHVAAAVKAGTTLIYARQMQRQVEKITM